jgi:hypothetical protein
VVRDLINKERGSILIALGPLYFRRHGMHVGVGVKENGGYRKFEIDNLLGRLTCPQEPRLLYTKALLHAVTSFALPDPLTACTGTEEAYHILRSSYCQSWTPVISADKSILGEIAALSPVREYYPKDKRLLQMAQWNTDLTITIQHDCFRPIVEDILVKSDRLLTFSGQKGVREGDIESSFEHLCHRGLIGRTLYERHLSDACVRVRGQDQVYKPTDLSSSMVVRQGNNVYCIIKLLHQQPHCRQYIHRPCAHPTKPPRRRHWRIP